MPITAFYAGLLALLFFVLSVRVIGMRRSRLISLGDGGDKEMLRRIRAHANCAEYVPIVLLLLALAESMRVSMYALHAIGIALVMGRTLHAFALSRPKPLMPARVGGMALTFTALLVGALLCLAQGLQAILT